MLFLLGILLSGTLSSAMAQRATVRGFIMDDADGLPLQGVNVVLTDSTQGEVFLGRVTNDNGLFVFAQINPGTYLLRASFVGFLPHEETVQVQAGQIVTVNFSMSTSDALLDEVLIESARETGAARVTAGLQSVRPGDLELIPSPDITPDLATYITAMPGVVSTGDRGGQLFIRGGEPSHNLITLDGMSVYQPFHVLGFYSSFSADMLSKVDIHSGGYDSRFSGRLSSVIDVRSRNGNLRQHGGSISLSPFVSGVRLEGPIARDKFSVLGSFRHSMIDQIASQYIAQDLPYKFGDWFGKAYVQLTEANQITFTALHTFDRGALTNDNSDTEEEVQWKNTAMGGRWHLLPQNSSLLGEFYFSVSRLEMTQGNNMQTNRLSEIREFNAGINLTAFAGPSEINYGAYLKSTELNVELAGLYQSLENLTSRIPKFGSYIDPNIHVTPTFQIRPGITGLFFDDYGFFVEPRARIIWSKGQHQLTAAGGLFHQDLTGLNDRRDVTNVFTAWVEAPFDKLTRAWHAIAGYKIEPTNDIEISIEGFYKELYDLYISEWTALPVLSTNLQLADGRAKGIDFRIELRKPNLHAFITYGLTFIEYEATQESLLLWYGTDRLKFRPPHDRRHQINAVANTTLGEFDISIRWSLGSGLPYTQVRGFDRFILLDRGFDVREVPGDVRVIYDEPYGGELPYFHRLDISIDRTFELKKGTFSIQGGVINVYNRANIFSLDTFTLDRVDQLPIVPFVGLKLER
ncbi:MAG: carboxypeptidase regulatory-like domain-containing protein [Rhodothermaceae bacterium]|nr:carboxypeptidase regulatory-like domain-containing protein [Rhodothermaceae bacterium]